MSQDPRSAVLVRRHRGVVELVLNRPEQLNAIDDQVAQGLQDALKAVRADAACRCLVLTGAGRGFCAGQALPRAERGEDLADIGGLVRDRYNPLVRALCSLPLPVLAAVNGPAVGAGLGLALAADLRVASQEAWFSCGFSKIGLGLDTGTSFFLPRQLGLSRALQMVLTEERLSATAAADLGLVVSVHPPDEFIGAYRHLATTLAEGPTRALGLAKLALRRSAESGLEAQLDWEATYQEEASETGDFREGVLAFREKRLPHFSGH